MSLRRVALVVWLTLLWLVLWRDLSAANALSGLVTAIAVTAIFPGTHGEPPRHTIRPHWLLAFLLYFHWKLLEANFVLAREIVTPRDHTRRGIIAVPVEGASELVITLVANAITLTPGTLTLEARRDPAVLYVHVLHLYDDERVRRDVRALQRLALRATGTDDVPEAHPAAEAGRSDDSDDSDQEVR